MNMGSNDVPGPWDDYQFGDEEEEEAGDGSDELAQVRQDHIDEARAADRREFGAKVRLVQDLLKVNKLDASWQDAKAWTRLFEYLDDPSIAVAQWIDAGWIDADLTGDILFLSGTPDDFARKLKAIGTSVEEYREDEEVRRAILSHGLIDKDEPPRCNVHEIVAEDKRQEAELEAAMLRLQEAANQRKARVARAVVRARELLGDQDESFWSLARNLIAGRCYNMTNPRSTAVAKKLVEVGVLRELGVATGAKHGPSVLLEIVETEPPSIDPKSSA